MATGFEVEGGGEVGLGVDCEVGVAELVRPLVVQVRDDDGWDLGAGYQVPGSVHAVDGGVGGLSAEGW